MIIQHMKSDPNATKHADLGLFAFALAIASFSFGFASFYLVLIASCIMGVSIEIGQRVYRAVDWQTFKWLGFTGSHQNTFKESCLDVIQTWLFMVTYYVNRIEK